MKQRVTPSLLIALCLPAVIALPIARPAPAQTLDAPPPGGRAAELGASAPVDPVAAERELLLRAAAADPDRARLGTESLARPFAARPGGANAHGGGPPPKTVQVDCDRGDSINHALGQHLDRYLTIEISGFCNEKVDIQRNDVTLIGSDPATDGIVGPAGDADDIALVELFRAEGVRLENLSIRESDRIGLGSWYSTLDIVNCEIVDNATDGAHFSAMSWALIWDTLFARNGSLGFRSQREAGVQCIEGCTFEDNGGYAVYAWSSGNIWISDSEITGPSGAVALEHGRVTGDNTPITATAGRALFSFLLGKLEWYDSAIDGRIDASTRAYLFLQSVTQTANPAINRMGDSSTFEIVASDLTGTTLIDIFSDGQALFGSDLGTLVCSNGADFFCDGTETKVSSSCGLCP